jgi:hypothetical protein
LFATILHIDYYVAWAVMIAVVGAMLFVESVLGDDGAVWRCCLDNPHVATMFRCCPVVTVMMLAAAFVYPLLQSILVRVRAM